MKPKNQFIIALILAAGMLAFVFYVISQLKKIGEEISSIPERPVQTIRTFVVKKPEIKLGKSVLGEASHYDYSINGYIVTKYKMVCATRDFPRYRKVKVTDLSTGKWVICKVTDFGPDKSKYPERVVDLGSLAFSMLQSKSRGIIQSAKVELIEN